MHIPRLNLLKLLLNPKISKVFDIEQYKQQIKKSLIHVLKVLSVSSCVDICNKTMQNSLDMIAPVVEKTVQQRPLQSWFNLKLQNLKKKKHQAERRYKKFPNKYNLQEYKKQQITYYSNIRQVRVDYFSRILQNSKKTLDLKLSGDTIQRVLPSEYATKTLIEMFLNYFYEKVTTIHPTINIKSSEIDFATIKIPNCMKCLNFLLSLLQNLLV